MRELLPFMSTAMCLVFFLSCYQPFASAGASRATPHETSRFQSPSFGEVAKKTLNPMSHRSGADPPFRTCQSLRCDSVAEEYF